MSTDEPYIPLGFRTKPTPFTIHVGDAEYVFPQSFDIKPAMTKEEEATFHNALEAHMDKFIDFDTLKQIAVEPSWYTSFGQFIPADKRKAKPNTERIFGEEYIQDKLDELRKQGYKVPESLSYARELLIDYDKLEKEDPPTSQSDPGSSKHPFWVDPLNEKGDEIPGNDRIDFNSLNQAGKREYEKRAALRIARRQVAEIVSEVSPINTAQVMQEMTDAINHPSHYTQYKGVEVIDITEQLNFNRGNAVKYIARAGFKSEDTEVQDLEKAKWYINREISRISENPPKFSETADARFLVEQMNYNRGNAVAYIAHAGTEYPEATSTDLYTAINHLDRELFRLSQYKEN